MEHIRYMHSRNRISEIFLFLQIFSNSFFRLGNSGHLRMCMRDLCLRRVDYRYLSLRNPGLMWVCILPVLGWMYERVARMRMPEKGLLSCRVSNARQC
ncbi:hypothetical protein BJX61DRAFT_442329 [Aspergillus egyptiacus]|nr:hypothetical protein BJX61DRAFT_442329 [Aspergillus egyptiacus]